MIVILGFFFEIKENIKKFFSEIKTDHFQKDHNPLCIIQHHRTEKSFSTRYKLVKRK